MLEKFTGEWTFQHAAHLLRRTTYGPRKRNIQEALDLGLDASIDKLLATPESVAPPVYIDFEADPQAGIGETWVNLPLDDSIQGIFFGRKKTIFTWFYYNCHQEEFNIINKLTLFWHNHFAISDSIGPQMTWDYFNLLRTFALGDFKEFTKKMTINKAMLVFLNGNENKAEEPNENYARELLELFTLGRGPLAGEGDYTNYTEQDIAAMARALTGWSPWNDETEGHFRDWAHDSTEKQLSHRFDNKTIAAGQYEDEYKNVIDIIFEKEEVARHISRRLFVWFVNSDINDEVESKIIEPMAQIIINNNYEVKSAIEALLSSKYFYRDDIMGCMIKNPLDYLMSLTNTVEVKMSNDIVNNYKAWLGWHWNLDKMGFTLMQLPSVAGWKAYYQEPGFYRDWINSASLAIRKKMLSSFHYIYNETDPTLQGFDFVSFIKTLEYPLEVNSMISELCSILFPRKLSQAHKDFFKSQLLNGLPDFEWTVEYEAYLQDPTDDKRQAIEAKLSSLFLSMFSIPEFQLN